MIKREPYTAKDKEILQQVSELLNDPSHTKNPLRDYLVNMLNLCKNQQDNLNRLITISDGYYKLARVDNISLNKESDRQAKRMKKLAKISDLYQNNLHKINIKMEQDALVDVLTGLYNRRYMMSVLDKYTKRAIHKSAELSIGMLDIDYFKIINDKYSHEIGDKALKAIAKTIQKSIRDIDSCGRWGGEEFLIVFPDTNLNYANQIAARILDQIAQIKIPEMANAPAPHITASIGITSHRIGETYTETLERADIALLKAKKDGKNTLISM